MAALIVGSLLALLGLVYVLWPIVLGDVLPATTAPAAELPDEASAIDALREIEFDQATGKLSAEDYASLRASYTPLALAELKARDGARTTSDLDPAEQLIARVRARARSCPACGARVESDEARFCTECGGSLAA